VPLVATVLLAALCSQCTVSQLSTPFSFFSLPVPARSCSLPCSNDQLHEYSGDRSARHLKDWALGLLPKHIKTVSKKAQLDDLLKHCGPGAGSGSKWGVCALLLSDKRETSALYKSLALRCVLAWGVCGGGVGAGCALAVAWADACVACPMCRHVLCVQPLVFQPNLLSASRSPMRPLPLQIPWQNCVWRGAALKYRGQRGVWSHRVSHPAGCVRRQ
jgi:hypothetical protein